jgi:hypothetical protein
MTSRVALAAILGTALALPACGNPLGINTPVCDQTSSALILSAQALPGTAFVPCINSLKTDWVYDDLRARRGRAEFGLGSLSMGMYFLRVTLQPTCDTSTARRVVSDEPGAPLFVDVQSDDQVQVVVVPDDTGTEVSHYADSIVRQLHRMVLGDRTLTVHLDSSAAAVSGRIAAARQAGATVLLVTVRDSEERTVTIMLPGEDTERTRVPVSDIADTLLSTTGPATYTGTWYYPFANGCVTYTFDAHGSGVATIEADVKAALGLHDAEAMRKQARDAGYDVR